MIQARHALAMAMLGGGDARWRGPSRSPAIGRPYSRFDDVMPSAMGRLSAPWCDRRSAGSADRGAGG